MVVLQVFDAEVSGPCEAGGGHQIGVSPALGCEHRPPPWPVLAEMRIAGQRKPFEFF